MFLFSHLQGATPLYTSCYNGHVDCVKELLGAAADVNQQKKDASICLHFLPVKSFFAYHMSAAVRVLLHFLKSSVLEHA